MVERQHGATIVSRPDREVLDASLADDAQFEPCIALREFETSMIAATAQSVELLGEATLPASLQQLINWFDGNANLIDDNPLTAPSKRILAIIPDYRTVRDGLSILEGELAGALLLTPTKSLRNVVSANLGSSSSETINWIPQLPRTS